MFLRACQDAARRAAPPATAVAAASLALLVSAASAQQLVYEEYGFTQGLGNSAINCLLEDRLGYLWVGTMSGLYRGDGEQFVKFDQSSGLPDATVQSLAEDGAGRIWAATRAGVAWRGNGRFHAVPFDPPAEIFGRRALAIAPDGAIWVATSRGLFHLAGGPREGSAFRLQRLPGLEGAAVEAVFVDRDGSLWLSARHQLWRRRAGSLERWGRGRGVPPRNWSDFARSPAGDLWVRGSDLLLRIPAGGEKAEDCTGPLPSSGFFGSLSLDRDGRLVVPTDGGLYVNDRGVWHSYGVGQGLPGQSVSVAMQDREGSLWLGLWGLGLVRVAGYGITETWAVQDGLGGSTVSAVLADAAGRIWAGTDNGLAYLDPGARRWKPLRGGRGLCGTKIRALATAGGSLYAGCFPGGVSRVDSRSFSAHRLAGPDRINGLLVDRDGYLWVASLEGLYRSDAPAGGSSVRLVRLVPPGAAQGEVYFRMANGQGGAVWVSSNSGLLHWQRNSWRRYSTAEGLRDPGLTHVAEDREGAVWVAYRRPLGVSRLRFDAAGNARGAEHFLDRLSSPSVLLVRTDAAGRVWIGGDNGLDVWEGGRWRRFSKTDGLAAHSCAVDSFYAAADGAVWIGTSRGVTRIRQTEQATEPLRRSIPLRIAWVRAGALRAEPEGEGPVEIGGRERSFAAGLSVLTWRHRPGVRLQYRLKGAHDHWVDAGSREARYTGVPPGRYVFEARALSPRDDLSFASVSIPVVVHPPFWMSWWFRALGIAAAAVAARLAWLWRIRSLRERQRLLEYMVRERTRQLRAEQERTAEALTRAEQASRFKSDFLARMSHEIRTPMHGVLGTADLLLQSGLSPDQEQLVRTLQQSAGTLLNLLNDILDLSKVEAGKLTLANRPFDLGRIVSNVVALMHPMAAKKRIALDVSLPGVPLYFLGDPLRIEQILLNLVSNAVKFTSEGFVEIAVSIPGGGRGFELAVRDSGCGIPADRLESIFQPFVQGDAAGQRAGPGTGLGLSICKALAEAMGGRISAESQPGEGSVFRVLLPLPAAQGLPAEPPEPPAAVTAAARRPLRVLVVEDNALNQAMVARMLAVLGHEAEVAGDGREAVERAMRGRFDAILMDIRLPEIDGLEAVRRLRRAGCRTPILALSANVYEADRAAAQAAGMDGFLGKPLHLDELRQALDRVAEQSDASGAG